MKFEQGPIPGSQQKINEYVERIKRGENKESIFQGLPPSFTRAIERQLVSETNEQEKELDLSHMSQNEFAQYLINRKISMNVDVLYDVLTVRPELRETRLKENPLEWSQRFELNRDYKEQLTLIENNKDMRGESNPGWVGIEIHDVRNKELDGRHKGYITLETNIISPFAQHIASHIEGMYRALYNAGYNGALKVPNAYTGLKLRFDNIVLHGATDKDVELGISTINAYLQSQGLNVESTSRGIDIKNEAGEKKSHTQILAQQVFDAIQSSL